MADLGFSGVVEKFEEHWGKRLTRWLLLLIGLGVSAVCIGAIYEWLIGPFLAFIGSAERSNTIASLALAALGIGGGVSLGSAITSSLADWKRSRRLATEVKHAEARLEEVERTSQRLIAEGREHVDATIAAGNETVQRARDMTLHLRTSLGDLVDDFVAIISESSLLPEDTRAKFVADAHDLKVALAKISGEISDR